LLLSYIWSASAAKVWPSSRQTTEFPFSTVYLTHSYRLFRYFTADSTCSVKPKLCHKWGLR